MNIHTGKTQDNKSRSVANEASQSQSNAAAAFQFADKPPKAIVQGKLQEMANNIPWARQLRSIQEMAINSLKTWEAPQL